MGMDLNLPADAQEVIINPVNPPPNQDFIELNDLIDVVEENIAQPEQQQQAPVQNFMQLINMNPNIVNGFPMPPLIDVIGEEIPPEQLVEMEDENEDNNIDEEPEEVEAENAQPEGIQMEAEEEDLVLDQLVGPGEGFPNLNNEGVQLPINPDEEMLLQLADEDQQQQLLEQQQGQVNEQIPQGFAKMEHDQIQLHQVEQHIPNNQNLQIGMTLIPELQWEQWGLAHRELLSRKKEDESIKIWHSLNAQGNTKNFFIRILPDWVPFFNTLLFSASTFEWAKRFLTSGASTYLDNNSGMITLPVPKACSSATNDLTKMHNVSEESSSIRKEKEGANKE